MLNRYTRPFTVTKPGARQHGPWEILANLVQSDYPLGQQHQSLVTNKEGLPAAHLSVHHLNHNAHDANGRQQ